MMTTTTTTTAGGTTTTTTLTAIMIITQFRNAKILDGYIDFNIRPLVVRRIGGNPIKHLVLKKAKLVFTSLKVLYCILDHKNTVV